MNTTTTNLSTLVIIKATNESQIFDSPQQAVEHLVKFGHLSIDKLTGNPLFILGEAMKKGIIEAKFNQEPEDRPALKMEIKAEPPKVKQLTIEGRPEPRPIPKPEPVKTEANPDKAAQLLALMGELITPQQAPINLEQVREVIREELSKQEPRKLEISYNGVKTEIEGHTRPQFETICKAIAEGLNIWLYGPAGSGKTHTAQQVAKALGLNFYSSSVCMQSTKTYLQGYNDARGQYVESEFFKAFKNGGLFLLDEADAGNANVLLVLNSAISNGFAAFPSGMVYAHPDFRVIAGANTIGAGGNQNYAGRTVLDGSSKDRFVYIPFGYDEKLETALSGNADFSAKVQALRAKATKLGIKDIISPRASINGAKLIRAGFTEAQALDMVIFNKMDEATVKLLKA